MTQGRRALLGFADDPVIVAAELVRWAVGETVHARRPGSADAVAAVAPVAGQGRQR